MIGAATFPVEHSIVRSIGLGSPNKNDMKVIADYGNKLNRKLASCDTFDDIQITVPGNTSYRKRGSAGLVSKTDVSLCTECGACVKACPTGAISEKDPKKIDKKKCISCQKCVRNCKQKARYVSEMKFKFLTKKLNKACKSDKAADIFL